VGQAHSGWWGRLRKDAFAQAAVAYAVYGVFYLSGALAGMTPERRTPLWGVVPWWAFFVAGGALVLLLPWLIARGTWWLALGLSPLVAAKALVLVWRQGRSVAAGVEPGVFPWVFACVAGITSLLLFRAGWLGRPRRAA